MVLKRFLLILFSGIGLVSLLGGFFFLSPFASPRDFVKKAHITVLDGAQSFLFSSETAATVGDFLQEKDIDLSSDDAVFPSPDTRLTSGTTIIIRRSRTFTLLIEERTETHKSRAASIEEALQEVPVVLDDDDIVVPTRETILSDEVRIKITRVEISEETEEKTTLFKTKTEEDEHLSWRKKIVTQKGEKGLERFTYRVSRHDGKEVNRKLLQKVVVKEPVTEVVTQGTEVKVGKSHQGGASWYAHTGTLAAANPWLPFGSYVRVTNTENGKSVIVKINDRGPFGAGRIIDLDRVAFQEIASLGAGVVHVKMEEIVN